MIGPYITINYCNLNYPDKAETLKYPISLLKDGSAGSVVLITLSARLDQYTDFG